MANIAPLEKLHPNLISEQPGDLHSVVTFIQDIYVPITHNHSSKLKSSLLSDVGNEELSVQLEQLLNENEKLKEKLQKNNKMMKEQLEKILALEKLVIEANSNHHAMHTDVKNSNHKSQSEEQLNKKITELHCTLMEVENMKVPLSDKFQELDKEGCKRPFEMGNLNEELTKQELIHDLECISSQLSNLQIKIKQLEESYNDFDTFINDENSYGIYAVVQLGNNYKDIKNPVKVLGEKQEKLQNLKKAFNQMEKNVALKLELCELKEELSSVCVIMEEKKSRWATVLLDLENCESQLKKAQNSDPDLIVGLKADLSKFEDLLTQEQLRNESLNNALSDAVENSKQLAEENERQKEEFDQSKVKLEKLVKQYKSDYELEKSAHESSEQKVEKLVQRINGLENQLGKWKSKAESCDAKLRLTESHWRKCFDEATSEKKMVLSSHANPFEMSCSCCKLSFTSTNALENHLRECLK